MPLDITHKKRRLEILCPTYAYFHLRYDPIIKAAIQHEMGHILNRDYKVNTIGGFGGEKYWVDSASGLLTLAQMVDGLQLAIPIMIKELATPDETGLEVTATKFVENEGATEFLAKYFGTQLNTMLKEFEASSKNPANNKDVKQMFFVAAEFTKSLIAQK